MIGKVLVVALAIVAATTSSALAQSATPGRVEASVGLGWTSAADYGSRDATETRADGSSLVLFSSSTQLLSSPVVEARVGVRLTRRLEVEATGSYGTPHLQVKTTRDYESAADATITASQQFYTIMGGALWSLTTRGRTVPFVTGGFGWVRQLQGNNTLVIVGDQWYAGGGVKRFLMQRDARRLKGTGLRVDARLIDRSKDVAVDARSHATVAVTAAVFLRF